MARTRTFAAPHVVAGATALLAIGLWVPGRWSELVFVVAAATLPATMLLLGVARRGRPGRLLLAALLTAACLGAGFVALVLLAGSDPLHRWVLGLPLSLAILIYGMTMAPLLILGVLYARDFERFRPRQKDLERIRSLSNERS